MIESEEAVPPVGFAIGNDGKETIPAVTGKHGVGVETVPRPAVPPVAGNGMNVCVDAGASAVAVVVVVVVVVVIVCGLGTRTLKKRFLADKNPPYLNLT